MKKLYNKYKEIINYIIIGTLTTFVSLGSYYLCVLTFLDPNNPVELQIANIIAWILAVAFSYITNRIYVFEVKTKINIKEISTFVGSRILSLFIDMFSMFVMVTLLRINDKTAKIIVQFIITAVNYVFSKLVFKKS